MKTEQEIISRIKCLHGEHREVKESNDYEYSILAKDTGQGRHVKSAGERIIKNEVKIRQILEKIRLLEWCIDEAEY